MNLVLRLTLPDGEVTTVDLSDVGLPCVIGRDSASAQIVIHDPKASRAHCTLSEHPRGLAVEDMNSMNGTFLDGTRIARGVLSDNQELRIGSTTIHIDSDEVIVDPRVGQTLGGFELIEAIGQGRYGTVYRANQINLGREVAVKFLGEEFRNDPEQVKTFLEEARRAGRLNHPNLVQVHDVVRAGEDYLLIMELMSDSLGEQLKEEGPLDEATVWDVLNDISKAIGYAEAQRLVHRDVKPDNILVNEEGSYKLADLGIAMGLGEDGQAHQDQVLGSPHYVAPEQARGRAIDSRADMYALGASAWHLLTGQPMFQGTAKEIVSMHVNTPVPDLRRLVPGITAGMVELVYRLLRKEPEQRPANAQELQAIVEAGRARFSQQRVGNPVRRTSRILAARRTRLRRRR